MKKLERKLEKNKGNNILSFYIKKNIGKKDQFNMLKRIK